MHNLIIIISTLILEVYQTNVTLCQTKVTALKMSGSVLNIIINIFKHTHTVNHMNIYLLCQCRGGWQRALRSAALPADSKMYLSGVYYQFDFIFSLPEV